MLMTCPQNLRMLVECLQNVTEMSAKFVNNGGMFTLHNLANAGDTFSKFADMGRMCT